MVGTTLNDLGSGEGASFICPLDEQEIGEMGRVIETCRMCMPAVIIYKFLVSCVAAAKGTKSFSGKVVVSTGPGVELS